MSNVKTYGNRRSEEDLLKLKFENAKSNIILRDQEDFKGDESQLEMMQNLERSYISGSPLVSDEEWDLLKSKFNYKESLTTFSSSGREWVKLFSSLPSINKACNLKEFEEFFTNFKEDQIYFEELKLDGLTANVRYKLHDSGYYELDCITSRGNGRYGLKLWPYALAGVRKNWPDRLPTKCVYDIVRGLPKYFELRGEAVIPKNKHSFNKYGKNAVWRNIASAMFNRKIPFNLQGLLKYISDNYNLSIPTVSSDGFGGVLILKARFEGRKCINPDVLESARLISSLFEGKDTDKFTKYDEVVVYESGLVEIRHENGNIWSGYDDGEELDIVFYSCSVDGSNIDNGILNRIPYIKTVYQVQFQEDFREKLERDFRLKPISKETSDLKEIWKGICEFYGTDLNGNRDFNLPRTRNMYEYACDGIVIKPLGSNKYTQNVDYRNSKNNINKIVAPEYPEDQIAVKLLSEMVKVKLEKIEIKETELGNITCSGILDKGYITESGAEVSNINLHNQNWLKENDWIKEGEEYWMIMSQDIIPVLLNPKEFPLN